MNLIYPWMLKRVQHDKNGSTQTSSAFVMGTSDDYKINSAHRQLSYQSFLYIYQSKGFLSNFATMKRQKQKHYMKNIYIISNLRKIKK